MRAVLLGIAILATALSFDADAQQVAQATGGIARAGTAAAVRGEVKLAAVPGIREVGKNVTSGDPIFLGDQVTTGAEGRLQIMLADETVFTIGPNAAMVIDTFVYDPATSAGKVTASVLKGTFRFVTGKVAKREPSDMEVKLPVGSIGVRGTSVAGEVDGSRATVILLGPGPDTNSGERIGRILVTGSGPAGAATTVEIIRPGFGTEINGAGVPPTPAVRIDPGRIAAITSPLAGTAPRPAAPQAPQGPSQPGSSQQQAQPGQPGAPPVPGQPQPGQPQPGPQAQGAPAASPAGGGIILARAPVSPAGSLMGIRTVGALAPAGQQAGRIVQAAGQAPPPPVMDGPTTFEQLRSLNLPGKAVYEATNIALSDPNAGTGSGNVLLYRLTADLNQRQATTHVQMNFNVNSGGLQNFTYEKTDSYANKTGLIGSGPITLVNGSSNIISGGIPGGHTVLIDDTPKNVAGKIAAILDVKFEVRNGPCTVNNCARGGRVINQVIQP